MTMPSIAGLKRYSAKRSVRQPRVVSEAGFEVRLPVAQFEPRVDGNAGVSDDREADAGREQAREHHRAASSPGADASAAVSALQRVTVVPQMQRFAVAEAGAKST